jgi:hypothetical protein
MYTGSMVGSGEHVFAVWGYAIAHVVDGVVELHPQVIATAIGTSIERVNDALTFLTAPDERSRNPKEGGRRLIHDGGYRYVMVSYDDYSGIKNHTDKTAYNRRKQQESRARRKQQSIVSNASNLTVDGQLTVKRNATSDSDSDSDSDLDLKSDPKAATADPKDLTGSARAIAQVGDKDSGDGGGIEGNGGRKESEVTDLESALRLPVFERAKYTEAKGRDYGNYLQPQEWPEVKQVAEAFAIATGLTGATLGSYSRDPGVQAVVSLLAAGHEPEQLERAIRHVVNDPWWTDGKSKGLSSLTPEVVRRALANAKQSAAGERFRKAIADEKI